MCRSEPRARDQPQLHGPDESIHRRCQVQSPSINEDDHKWQEQAELLQFRERRIPEVREQRGQDTVSIQRWQWNQIERGQQHIERNEFRQEHAGKPEVSFRVEKARSTRVAPAAMATFESGAQPAITRLAIFRCLKSPRNRLKLTGTGFPQAIEEKPRLISTNPRNPSGSSDYRVKVDPVQHQRCVVTELVSGPGVHELVDGDRDDARHETGGNLLPGWKPVSAGEKIRYDEDQ